MTTNATSATDQSSKLSFAALPKESGTAYQSWKFGALAKILKCGPDPSLSMIYIREMDDMSISNDDLAQLLPAECTRLDVSVFAELVDLLQKDAAHFSLLENIMTSVRFGCGRHVFRALDLHFRNEGLRRSASE